MRLACVTVPNFRIALERTRAPHLAARPVAIGEPAPGANEIVDCSIEAAGLGVRIGMPLRDARTIAPDLILLPPDPAFYARSFDAMLFALEDLEPAVEPADEGIAYTAIDPNADAEAEQLAAVRLVQAIREQTRVVPAAGVGTGKFAAWIAATISAPGAVTVIPDGSEPAFLAPLCVSYLPVSFEVHRKLPLYALSTIADVARLSLPALQAQFGPEGRRLSELARGVDRDPFRPRTRVDRLIASLTMPAPTVNSEAMIIAARTLVARLMQKPAMRFRQLRQLRLSLLLLNGGSWERTLTFREPLSDDARIVYVLKKLIEPLQLPGPVEEMSLEFIGLAGEVGKQRSLLFAEQARRRVQLLAALRQLKAQYGGESQVSRLMEVEPWSRIPERRYALIDYEL